MTARITSQSPEKASSASDHHSWDISQLRQIQQRVRRINAGLSLQDTLQAVVDGVVEVAGFQVAVLNHLQPDGMLACVAVAGHEDARTKLLGNRTDVCEFEEEFALAEDWGALCFVPHERLPVDVQPTGWIPHFEMVDEPDAWHPQDALFAPLYCPDNKLIGVLSVDLPSDRRRPGPFQREVLEMYAAHAALAIHHARIVDKLTAEEHAFRLAFEAAGTGMAVISIVPSNSGRYRRVNRAFCEMLGYTEEELLSRSVADITHPDDHDADKVHAERAAGGQRLFRVEKRYMHASGGSVWVAVTASIVEDANGPAFAISQIEDVGARRAVREQLTRLASRDSLTGLSNRHALYHHLNSLSPGRDDDDGATAVLFCDLDGFKLVNDRFGHAVGDEVLIVIAQRLKAAARRGHLVARLGGDEFILVTPATAATTLAGRLLEVVAEPVKVQGHTLRLACSIGIAATPSSGIESRQLIHEADLAMYRAKRSGGNSWTLHDEVVDKSPAVSY